jgi:single-strand DNA-binding protein
MSLNKVMIIGRVGKDPELKYTAGGAAVAKFSVATSKRWKDQQGQQQEKTEWHNIDCWGKLAENVIAKYVKKGSQIFVEGELQTQNWDDANGVKHYRTSINMTNVTLLGSKQDGGNAQPSQGNHQVQHQTAAEQHFADDSIPF